MGRILKWIDWGFVATAAVVLSMVVSACVTVPAANFQSYLDSYSRVRITTQDMFLSAKSLAEAESRDATSTDPADVRVRKLKERQEDADARLAMLQVISEYNDVLVALAQGTNPKAVQGDMESIASGLQSLSSRSLSTAIGSWLPFAGIASQAVALIDDALKKQKFQEAVAAAQNPVYQIIGILKSDADELQIIGEGRLSLEQLKLFGQQTQLRQRALALANMLKSSDPAVSQRITENLTQATDAIKEAKFIRKLTIGDIQYSPAGDAKQADAAALQSLALVVDEIKERRVAVDRLWAQNEAQTKLIAEYKEVLTAMQTVFKDLNRDVAGNRTAATVAFGKQALALRKAYLELQEAR